MGGCFSKGGGKMDVRKEEAKANGGTPQLVNKVEHKSFVEGNGDVSAAVMAGEKVKEQGLGSWRKCNFSNLVA